MKLIIQYVEKIDLNIFYLFFFLKSEEEKQLQERIKKLLTILNGEITIDLHMQFLIKNNHADLLILKQIKVNQKFKIFFFLLFLFIKQDVVQNPICHTATIIANGFMLSGTTSDQFLK